MPKKFGGTTLLLFSIVFVAEFALGYYIACIHGYVQEDAMSRVANAFYISHSRDPHLAAIGFVWNPLPSLIEWVWLLLWPLFPQLASASLAGTLTTALFAAGTFVLLFHHCRNHGLSAGHSLVLCLCYALNPFIFLYGANGMSEIMFAFFLLLAVTGCSEWLAEAAAGPVIRIGMALALGFLVRYEAIPVVAAIACGFAFHFMMRSRTEAGGTVELRRRILRMEGNLIVLLAPILYTCVIWMFLNEMIMDHPLYFLNSSYSNLSFSELLTDKDQFAAMIGNPLLTLRYVLLKSAYFCIPAVIILLFRIFTGTLLRLDLFLFILLLASIPALQFVMLMNGSSYGWFRFFFYILPVAVAWIPYEIRTLKLNRRFALACHYVGLIVTAIWVGAAMTDPAQATEEYDIFHKRELYWEQQTANEIAGYIDENLPDARILLDTSTDFQIVLKVRRPDRLIITSDRDFERTLQNPQHFPVDYMLIPSPDEEGHVNAVNSRYPELYEHGAAWATLERQFGDYRKLYRIHSPKEESRSAQ